MRPVPILFLSDNPTLTTGLARITKDLASLTATLPQFRVGTLGRGGMTSTRLPFAQYAFPDSDQWGEEHLQSVWEDFAGQDQGVVMTIWDPSRLGWFANPMMGGGMEEFLRSGRFKRWGYFPVDSYGVGERLTGQVGDTISKYDRILAYTMFGLGVIESTIGVERYDHDKDGLNWIPHGYDPDKFQPRGKTAGRMSLGVGAGEVLVGCVMTNQARKDWATAFGAIAYLKNSIPNLKFWCHVDTAVRYWDLRALCVDMGLVGTVITTYSGQYNSEQLSYLYSACDITILPSLGEGFGYPIIESMACGVPVLHGDYGGGSELVRYADDRWLVGSKAQRLDGMWNCVRPVWDPRVWGEKLREVVGSVELRNGELEGVCTRAVQHLTWKNLWPVWEKWLIGGLTK